MKTPTVRMKPADRTQLLLDVAVQLAQRHGLANLTRDQIAEAAGVAQGLVTTRLGTMAEMRRAVMRQAVKREILSIVAEGLATRNEHALKAPPALRAKALASLAPRAR